MKEGYWRILIYFTSRRQGTAFQYYRMIRLRYTLYYHCPNLRFTPLLSEKKERSRLSFSFPFVMKDASSSESEHFVMYLLFYAIEWLKYINKISGEIFAFWDDLLLIYLKILLYLLKNIKIGRKYYKCYLFIHLAKVIIRIYHHK